MFSQSNRATLPAGFTVENLSGDQHRYMSRIEQLRRVCWPTVYAQGASCEDGFDAEGRHWMVFEGDTLIAAARLTVHHNLQDVPDVHLFKELRPSAIRFPIGFISRLVVHPEWRGKGVAAYLDRSRIDAAIAIGCKQMLVDWTPLSGLSRHRQLLHLGFVSPDEETPHDDGPFGHSFLLILDLA